MTITTKDEIAQTVKEVFQSTLKIDPSKIEGGTSLKDDLELDSLDMIEVVYELEDKFDVQIPEDRIAEIRTFDEVVDGLHAALSAKAG